MNYINLATEDALSEAIGLKLISENTDFEVSNKLRRNGNGYLRASFSKFCNMARRQTTLIITDLDAVVCPLILIRQWSANRQIVIPENMIFRIAVREVEAWILADHLGLALLFGKELPFPENPDILANPKETLLRLARQATRSVKNDLVAEKGAVATQGINYNQILCKFVTETWCAQRATERSDSLNRAVSRLRQTRV